MTTYLLGIDIGTGSTKGVLARPDGSVVATASRAHEMSLPRPGWAEMDAEAIWWGDVVSLANEFVEIAGDTPISGVCVSGLGPCLLLCDEQDRPLRPAILYGIDMRAIAEIEELTERYGAETILQRGGTLLSSQAVGPKALWVSKNEPETWERARRWHNSNSFVAARLTGEYALDHHTASQCDPLYDIRANTWFEPWADDVMAHLSMPRLAWPSEVIGTVQAGAASETGLAEGTPVCIGTVDAWAEAFSAGVRRPGDLMLMYGSTMFFVRVLDDLRSLPMLWTTVGVEPSTYTLAAGMSTSGSLTAWMRDLVGGASFEQLANEAAQVPPGSDGLLLLPYFAGERTPIFDAKARGVFAGLSLRHHRGHLFRAVYEGIAFGIRQILELLEEDADAETRLVAVGGGTQGGLWTQIVSDVTGSTQMLPAQTIGASYGDALLAGIGSGLIDKETDWARVDRHIEPNPEVHEIYDQLYEVYQDLYPATRDLVHVLADIQESSARP